MSRGPGRWQKMILDLLDKYAYFELTYAAYTTLERRLEYSEYVALHRAAKALDKQGKCMTTLHWSDEGPKRRLCTTVWRPDIKTANGQTPRELSVKRVTSVTGTTYMGSYRHIGQAIGVSHTTVWRDLKKHAEAS